MRSVSQRVAKIAQALKAALMPARSGIADAVVKELAERSERDMAGTCKAISHGSFLAASILPSRPMM